MAVISVCMRNFLSPHKQGFFKDDESLMHPYHSSTIPSYVLYIVGFLVPPAVMLLVELIHVKNIKLKRGNAKNSALFNKQLVWNFYHLMCLFIFGAGVTHLLTNIPKYCIGRLRPHFIEVCKPDWSLVNDTSKYITEDICTGEKALIQEARLSFPSGHSSMALYCAVVFMLYLQKRFTWKGVFLIRPLIQTIAFSMAFFTCLSRISDYKHHWSDVLGGAVLGIVIGYIIAHAMVECVFKKAARLARTTSGELPSTFSVYRSSPVPASVSTHF
ncbi:putative phosphatidate phosphatase isoform X3 [Physella acuta]|uniref:putative phosphatidate phosphatase isoform X2 n=1 Tax=Physella acuta TaxID=109671 RepID=UPI0027DB82B5|nr:putative phosphatidate phosphatase isoform X2 [Physella acuta]XP_059156020.1 putative phosphatidate phosphatase isoform X3 [Physella acuta]